MIRAHVETLAGAIGERNVFRPRALAGAHYDSVVGSPCADDNASTVEVLAADA